MVKVEYQLSPAPQWPLKYIECTEEEWESGDWKYKERYHTLIFSFKRVA